MFSLKEFIKKGLLDAVGNLPEYKIRLNAVGWLEKGVLEESDLADIEDKLNAESEASDSFMTETESEASES